MSENQGKNSLVSLIPKELYSTDLNIALQDYMKIGKERGLQAQADLCPQLITNNIIKDKALIVMRDTLREQELEIQAYEKTLGRKLTTDEVSDFITSHSTPALFDKSDSRILSRLNRNLEKSKQLTKQ